MLVDMCEGKGAIECNPINMFCGRILWALHHDKDVIWLDKQALEANKKVLDKTSFSVLQFRYGTLQGNNNAKA